jgi:pantetheine-phosphate adenylyltransferase
MDETQYNYNDTAIIGGTFNEFHIGHQEYVKHALRNASYIFLFLTTDSYAQKLKNYTVKPYEERKEKIIQFLLRNNFNTPYEIISLDSSEQLIDFCLIQDISKAFVIDEYISLFDNINSIRKLQNKNVIEIKRRPRFKIIFPELCSTFYHTLEASDPKALGFPVLAL